MKQLADQGRAQALARGYVEKTRSRLARALALAALSLTAALAALLVAGAVSGRGSETLAIGLVAGIVAAILAASFLPKQRMLTPEGAEARAHLLGVREFIRVAEADRLRALQSYTGAERTPEGEVDVIRVYERLLPYAMLLGLEKSWIRVLEVSYEQTDSTPYWFPALAVHGLGGFSSTMSHFTTSLNSAVAYTSSSSGGSTGGGFAGGGGGGGFSGGH
jgi:uncharacterized membrane protein YgcG